MRNLHLLIVLFCGWGCKSNEPDHLIVGEWVWQKSQGGWTGNDVRTPGGATEIAIFTRRGRYESRSNGVLRSDGDYAVETTEDKYGKKSSRLTFKNYTLYKPDGKTVQFVVSQTYYLISTLDRKTLSYFDFASEGYTHSYTRK